MSPLDRDATVDLLELVRDELDALIDSTEWIKNIIAGGSKLGSEKVSMGGHSDPTGQTVVALEKCRSKVREYDKAVRRALYKFRDDLVPAYESLRDAYHVADPRAHQRLDNRLEKHRHPDAVEAKKRRQSRGEDYGAA